MLSVLVTESTVPELIVTGATEVILPIVPIELLEIVAEGDSDLTAVIFGSPVIVTGLALATISVSFPPDIFIAPVASTFITVPLVTVTGDCAVISFTVPPDMFTVASESVVFMSVTVPDFTASVFEVLIESTLPFSIVTGFVAVNTPTCTAAPVTVNGASAVILSTLAFSIVTVAVPVVTSVPTFI